MCVLHVLLLIGIGGLVGSVVVVVVVPSFVCLSFRRGLAGIDMEPDSCRSRRLSVRGLWSDKAARRVCALIEPIAMRFCRHDLEARVRLTDGKGQKRKRKKERERERDKWEGKAAVTLLVHSSVARW